jgi:diguanylate cyclase (GGDEF)-like protein
MYCLLREMEQEELRLLALRTADEAHANRRVILAEAAASAALGLLLVLNYLAIRRQGRQSEDSRRALANSEERLAITLRSIGDGVLATDTEGRIIHMNPVAERLTGWSFEEARGLPMEQVFRIVHEQTREQMHQLSYFDPVTGLPNEARFTQLAAMAIETVQPGGLGLAAVQVRLERLRDINEALGLQHGDDLLRQFGQRLQSVLPLGASAARLRGDEFAMLLPGSSITDAVLLARQMQSLLATPFRIAELPVEVAARMGITHFPQHAQTVHAAADGCRRRPRQGAETAACGVRAIA